MLILLFLTSTNFAVFLKQQCHWTQKIPLVSKMISCPVQPETAIEMGVAEEDGCFEVDGQALRAYDTFEALGNVVPDRTARANRTISIQRHDTRGEHAVHRIVITQGGATSPQALRLDQHLKPNCKAPTLKVYTLRPE
ncbi:MAG: hypothetical protein AAGJ10_04965 [Bacteroidota bacterium]